MSFWGFLGLSGRRREWGCLQGQGGGGGEAQIACGSTGLTRSDLIEILCWLCSQATAPRSCAMKDERRTAQREKEGQRHAHTFPIPAKSSLHVINIGWGRFKKCSSVFRYKDLEVLRCISKHNPYPIYGAWQFKCWRRGRPSFSCDLRHCRCDACPETNGKTNCFLNVRPLSKRS